MSNSHPLSEARVAANRANAAERTARHSGEPCALKEESTGPRTPEDKAASSRNAPEAHRPPLGRPVVLDQKVAHGFRASSFAVVRLEELDEVANLKADAIAFYNPSNAQELFAVERIALAQHMMFRAARLEAGLFTTAMNESLDRLNHAIKPMDETLVGHGDIDICKSQNRNYCLGEGFRRMAAESNVWSLMLRYRAQADREYRRALEDFERLKALRNQLPNEPNNLIQPEEPEELVPPHELNFCIPKKPQQPAEAAVPRPTPAPVAETTPPPAGNGPLPRPKSA